MEKERNKVLIIDETDKNIKINGIELAEKIMTQIRQQFVNIRAQFKLTQADKPLLQIINIGHDIGSATYISRKAQKAEKLGGIQYFIHQFIVKNHKTQQHQNQKMNQNQYEQVETMLNKIPQNKFKKYEINQNTSNQQFKKQVQNLIQNLNKDQSTTAILIQLPIHQRIKDSTQVLLNKIDVEKDVDCLTKARRSIILDSTTIPELLPCAVQGIIRIFDEYKFELQGINAVMIGYSNLIGKILSHLLIVKKATVTICHIYTKDVNYHTKNADLVISATGVANLVNQVKQDCILIDVGFGKTKQGKFCGDISNQANKKASYYTPVPGGIGPMTIAMLMQNFSKLWRTKHQNKIKISQ